MVMEGTDMKIAEINSLAKTEMRDLSVLPGGLIDDDAGPLWYRGLSQGDEAAEHQATPACRKMVADDHGVASFAVGEVGVEHEGREAGQDPGPRAQGVVGQVEPECGSQGMFLVSGR